MRNVRIIVASHIPYWMPADEIYLTVQAGSAEKESIPGLRRDDEGESISERNARLRRADRALLGMEEP